MPISVSCPGCSATLTAPDSAAGKKVKCPKPACGMLMIIPDALAPDFEVVEDRPAPPKPKSKPVMARVDDDEDEDRPRKRSRRDDDDDEDDRPRSRRRDDDDDDYDDRPRKKKRKKKGMGAGAIVAIVLGGLVVVAGGGYGIYAARE